MEELRELRIKNARYRAIVQWFKDQSEDLEIDFMIEDMTEPISDLTDNLFEVYENTSRMDSN